MSITIKPSGDDDSDQLQEAVSKAGVVFMEPGVYRISRTIHIEGRTVLVTEGVTFQYVEEKDDDDRDH